MKIFEIESVEFPKRNFPISCTIFPIDFHCHIFISFCIIFSFFFFFFLYKSSNERSASINGSYQFHEIGSRNKVTVAKFPPRVQFDPSITRQKVHRARSVKRARAATIRAAPPPSRNGKAKSVAWKRVSHPGSLPLCIYRILV